MKWARVVKYGMAAPLLDPLVRHTSWFDGAGVPPEHINFAGGGDFAGIGRRQTDLIQARAGMDPGHKVLDIGCGIGRVALALSEQYPQLEYDGFDIVRYGITWCVKRFRNHPTYRFHHADIRNTFYNPFGRLSPDDFTFPYADATFDRVIATSVFTHLLASTARRYLAESARVLTSGGRLYMTVFIVPEGGMPPASAFRFANRSDQAWVESAAEPELAVAYPLSVVDTWAERAGLSRTAHYGGSWSGGEGEDFQDALVFVKR